MSTPLEAVYEYCLENSLIQRLELHPFCWPSQPLPHLSAPLSPELSACFPLLEPLDDIPIFSEADHFLGEMLHVDIINEVFETRKVRHYRLEHPILPRRAGPDHLRSYGPKSLQQIPPIPKITLSKEDGMEMLATEDVSRTIKKDCKLVISQETVEFLKDVVCKCNNPKLQEIILDKPPRRGLWISPPLVPMERRVEMEDVKPLKIEPAMSSFNYSIMSPLSTERLSSPVEEYSITPSEKLFPPMKITLPRDSWTCDLSTLRLETPITPRSIQEQHKQPYPYPSSPFPHLKSPSPPTPLPASTTLTQTLFREEISPEMRLRLIVPSIPAASPKKYPFQKTMYEIYVAQDGMGCDIIPRSIIDGLNEKVKWVPIKSRTTKFLNIYTESVEGVGFEMVDVQTDGVRWEFIMSRRDRVLEEELLTKREEMDNEMEDVIQIAYSSPRSVPGESVAEAVRKRKFQGNSSTPTREEEKRIRYNYKGSDGGQMSRVCEYMVLRGRTLPTIEEEPVSPVVYNIPSGSISVATPSILSLSPIGPSSTSSSSSESSFLPTKINPDDAVPAMIISVTSLPHNLQSRLPNLFPNTLLFERALPSTSEGDIILSPNRCLILCTLAQITQSLPSHISSRIKVLAQKYRQIEVIVQTGQAGIRAGVGEFCGWLEQVRRDKGCGIRVIYVKDNAGMDMGLEKWIGFLGLNRVVDGQDLSGYLNVEETDDDWWLRGVFNVYAAQVISAHFTIEQLRGMTNEERREKLFPLVRERLLVKFNEMLDKEKEGGKETVRETK